MVHGERVHFLVGIDPAQTLVIAGIILDRQSLGQFQGSLVIHSLTVIDIAQVRACAGKGCFFLQALPVLRYRLIELSVSFIAYGLDKAACRPVGTELQNAFFRLLPFGVTLFLSESVNDLSRLRTFARQAEGPVKTEAQGSKERNRQYRSFFHRRPRTYLLSLYCEIVSIRKLRM